jgi:hypothetical protein
MPLAIRKRILLPVWLAMIAAQPSAGNADTEPRRLASPRKCVDLLPPEAIEAEEIEPDVEWPAGATRVALRERAETSPADFGGSVVPSPFAPRFDETRTGLLVVCAGAAAGGLWLAFVHRRSGRRDARIATVPPVAVDVDLLKPLIANVLPVIEETLMFPRMARLHGRPIASERYRLDAAQPLGEPHFSSTPGPIEVDVDVVHWVSAAEPGVKEPSFRRYGPSALERALATVEGD